MTKREMIQVLSTYDLDTEVVIADIEGMGFYYSINTIKSAHIGSDFHSDSLYLDTKTNHKNEALEEAACIMVCHYKRR